MSVSPQMLIVSFLCSSFFIFAFEIPTVFYAFQDEDHLCQSEHGEVSLSTWLKVTALTSFSVMGFHLLVLFFVTMIEGMNPFLLTIPVVFAFEIFFLL